MTIPSFEEIAQNISRLNRRSFALRATSIAAATLLTVPPGSLAQTEPAAAEDFGPKPKDLSEADWDEVHAKYANLMRVYSHRLSTEDRHRARTTLIVHQHMLASIRKFQVSNGDPSACTLRL